MKEKEVLDKALAILDDALNGKVVDPNALSTAISMTQFFWSSVYSDRAREAQITEALKDKWAEEIKDKKE